MYLGDENVALTHVAEGWAKVKPARDGAADEDLSLAERDAQARGSGLWTRDPAEAAAASRSAPAAFDARAFFAANRGVPVKAIVEAVFNGSCVRVCLRTDSARRARVAGDASRGGAVPEHGQARRDDPGTRTGTGTRLVPRPSPSRSRARRSTSPETRALHRDVTPTLEGEDKYRNLYATVSLDDAPTSTWRRN